VFLLDASKKAGPRALFDEVLFRRTWQFARRVPPQAFPTQEVYLMGANEVANDSLNAHIRYLEDEVKKMDERAGRLDKMIPDTKNEPKRQACRELVNGLRDEASQYRKYLALVKRFIQHE
jgi:hypothetical protein